MADSWEIILHHTYAGVPGIVYDQSPSHRSHGVTVGLSDGDFLIDGAVAGSGAVVFAAPTAAIQVPTSACWWRLGAVKVEVTLMAEPGPVFFFLIDAGSFRLSVRSGQIIGWHYSTAGGYSYSQIDTHLDGVSPTGFRLPTGRWITVGYFTDGIATQELTLDGRVVARRTQPTFPVAGAGDVTIGNAAASGSGSWGQLDEVKVWRYDPRQLADDFYARPVDDSTAECLIDYRHKLEAWAHENPHCATQFTRTVRSAFESALRAAWISGSQTQDRIAHAVSEYQRLWRSGGAGGPEMAGLLTKLETWLQLAEVGIDTNPEVAQLVESQCFQKLLRDIGPIQCDPELRAMLSGQPSTGEAAH